MTILKANQYQMSGVHLIPPRKTKITDVKFEGTIRIYFSDDIHEWWEKFTEKELFGLLKNRGGYYENLIKQTQNAQFQGL